MSDQDVANNWRLEDSGETQDRWKLQAAEQNAIKPWQLQDEQLAEATWQPVDYNRERRGASNWVLPSLVVLAFITVIAYIAWIGLTRSGLLTPTASVDSGQTNPVAEANQTPIGEPTISEPAVAPTLTLTTAPAELATATSIPTPTPSPTPTVVRVTQEFVSVNDPAGVNARSEPNTTSAVVKLLEPGQRLLVVQQSNEWIQVALAANQLAWVKAEVVDRSSQLVTLDEANQRRSELGLAALTSAEVAALAPTGAVTNTAPITSSVGATNTGSTTPVLVSNSVTGTINSTGGLNARVAPTTTATTVKLLPDGSSYPLTGRSADKQWLQVRLEDGATAWVFAQFVTVSGDSNALPVPSTGATNSITRTLAVAPTSTVTGFAGITSTTTVQPVPTAPSGGSTNSATATVSNLAGANARPTPDRNATSLNLFPFEAVLPAVGRSADNQWVQVQLEDGQRAWMLASAVKVSVDLTKLPAVNP